jgi:hypothetical protein
LTKAATFLALMCVLILGASAASILARAAVPAAGSAGVAAIDRPVSNRDGKMDKLAVATVPAITVSDESDDQQQAADAPAADPDTTGSTKPVQLAYATDEIPPGTIPHVSEPRAEIAAPKPATKLAPVIATAPAHKPKPAARPAPKEAALLSDGQIAQIKTRLNLSSSQEYYWPSVEQALRAIGRKIHAVKRGHDDGAPPIDPDSAEVQQLKYAAMPLLFQLREDQKQEVRKLARTMGLEQVAQQI